MQSYPRFLKNPVLLSYILFLSNTLPTASTTHPQLSTMPFLHFTTHLLIHDIIKLETKAFHTLMLIFFIALAEFYACMYKLTKLWKGRRNRKGSSKEVERSLACSPDI
jgi:hypothetical protein